MALGDLHGNTRFVEQYIYPTAARQPVDAIIQVGDFGYWEHEPGGVKYLDRLSIAAEKYEIPMYWLRGNHDKYNLALEKYGDRRTEDGFIICRPGVYLIPDGHTWTWADATMRAFGGAYSTDKAWRLELEQKRWRVASAKAEARAAHTGGPVGNIASTAGTLWFPEEEMTDGDMAALLDGRADKLDVIFSHDKPRSSNPRWNRKDLPECWPNQDRLQRALLAHQPTFWVHGHLHHRYIDVVRSGDDSSTRVIGLHCDDEAGAERFYRSRHAWCLLELDDSGDGPVRYVPSSLLNDAYDDDEVDDPAALS